MRGRTALAVLGGFTVVLAAGCGAQTTGAGASPRGTAPPAARTSSPGTSGTRGNGDVPWIDKVAPAYSPPVPSPPPTPAAKYEACTAGQLTGRAGGFFVGMQSGRYLVLTNTGTKPCTLSGGPSSVVGIAADGSRQTLATGATDVAGGFGDLSGPPANLRPGQSAQLAVWIGSACTVSREYTALVIGIGATGGVRVLLPGGRPFAGCGTETGVSEFGVPVHVASPPRSPLRVLALSRSMPPEVRSGGTARFTVTLTNPTSHPVPLSPCPSYEEYMIIPGPGAPGRIKADTRYYYLNCQAAPDIPAHGSVTFDMQMPVPSGTGQAKYAWVLQVSRLGTGGVTRVG